MTKTRTIEVFSAGCPVCKDTIALINQIACSSCEIRVLNMNDPEVSARASKLGIRSVPAVAIDGVLATCCAGRGVKESALRAAGVGRPMT